ncbi:cyclic nucleotide-binding domain-containing protein [Nostoc spongiaeforme FACHB-130]|uniref:Cyclic nucleotide-binding domain-containing protein n=1 Tax=Nostoc spongiaeforme FACHB-130 TaxID=1357510 RepID=A0ABR8FRF2_9NOSO|nr:cyclic nucleotide-binding domain-containing protein [Nostoc spongiaeforme]MBD2593643.1 cyclic nucleotide-binding domain-containing protein [Nostoc spongiaeforme FACHB-130]
MVNQTVISIQNLNHFFGEAALKKQILFDINITIKAKEFVILTGPSGSGKSTLLSLIGCLRSVQHGSLNILGQELNGATQEQLVQMRRNFGYITQSSNLLDFLTVQQNIQMSLELQPDFAVQAAWAKTIAILESVGLREKIDVYPKNLSGGQKQRVAIACALVTQPKLVLADEPTAALDKSSGRNVVALMHRLAKEHNSAVLMVTHDHRILDLADRIVHVEDGKLGLALNQELSLMLPGFDETLLEKANTKPTVLTYASEEIIVRQGEPATKFYILLEGDVEVFQDFPDQPTRLLNRLSRGDYFGEVGLLRGGKRTATVRVTKNSEVKVMVIEEELFQLFVNNSELTSNDVVRRLHQRVMTSHLSKALPNVDPSEIVAIASQSKGSQYKANSIIVQQGEFGDRVYLILEGEVEISVIDQGESRTIQLKSGEHFGNVQFSDGQNYPVYLRAIACTDVELMAINRDSFCSLILKSNTNSDIVASVLHHQFLNL